VNAANNSLLHDRGVAAAINKASGGAVQRESAKIINSAKVIVTDDAVCNNCRRNIKVQVCCSCNWAYGLST